MGLIERAYVIGGHYSVRASADWPVRILYGLVTIYQGLFGLLIPSNLLHQVLVRHEWTMVVISGLLITGGLLVIDGLIGMIRYCTRVNCFPVISVMRLFHRWRHLLFLPPVFCYFLALQVASHEFLAAPIVYAYYITLALCGMAFCLRDGVISNQCNRRGG